MIEAVKTLPIANQNDAGPGGISVKNGPDLLFEQYELPVLQNAMCIYFYYSEFMDDMRKIFKEAATSPTLNIHEQVSLYKIYTSANNMIQRVKHTHLPNIEAILEVLMTKTQAETKLKAEPLILQADAISLLSGNTISYLEFSQAMVRSRTLLEEIYEPVFNKHVFQVQEKLKEIAAEKSSQMIKEQMKRAKTIKKKGRLIWLCLCINNNNKPKIPHLLIYLI